MSETFAKNSFYSTIAGVGTALASLASLVIVARLLGTNETGIFAYSLWIAMFAVTVADFGIYQSLTRYLPELTTTREDNAAAGLIAYLLRPTLVLAGLGAGGFLALGLFDHRVIVGLQPETILCIGLLFTTQLVSNFGLGVLRGMQRFDTVAKFTIFSLLLQLVAVVVGALIGRVNGALLGYCLGFAIPIVVLTTLTGHRARVDQVLRRRVLKFALFSWGGAIAAFLVWSRLELFFLQRYFGPHEVALFSAGLTLSNLASQGPLLLTGGLLPYFSETSARNSFAQLASGYATATRVMAFLLFPICFGFAALTPIIVPLLYGTAFAEAVPSAALLIAGAAIGASGSVGSQMIYARERSDFIFFSGTAGAALSILAGLLVIPAFGLIGAASARIAVHTFMVGFGSWFIWRRLGCPIPFSSLWKLLLSAIVCAAFAHICVRSIPNPMAALAAAIVAGALAYMMMIRLLEPLPPQDMARLRSMTARLPATARGPVSGLLTLLSPTR